MEVCIKCFGEGRIHIQHPMKPLGVSSHSIRCDECNPNDEEFKCPPHGPWGEGGCCLGCGEYVGWNGSPDEAPEDFIPIKEDPPGRAATANAINSLRKEAIAAGLPWKEPHVYITCDGDMIAEWFGSGGQGNEGGRMILSYDDGKVWSAVLLREPISSDHLKSYRKFLDSNKWEL